MLERAPSITIELGATQTLAVVGGRSISLGVHALEVLALCTERTTLSDLAARARVEGQRDFIDFMAAASDLLSHGLLRDADAPPPPVGERGAWADPTIHTAMLNDRERSVAFVEAIRAAVTPDDVVLDIGTGTGILAIAAAQAGARRVFAVEASEMSEVATEMVIRNGVADRVEVIRGFSTRVKLPERATVLVTETIGNDPFAEHTLEIMQDAHKRLLTAGARVIPARLTVSAIPVAAPPALLDRLAYTRENVERWSSWLDMDLSPLVTAERRAYATSIPAERARALVELGPPRDLGVLDYSTPSPFAEAISSLPIERAGRLAGVLMCFEIDVGAGRVVSTRPSDASVASHWMPTLWIDPRERDVEPGDRVDVRFQKVGSTSSLEILG